MSLPSVFYLILCVFISIILGILALGNANRYRYRHAFRRTSTEFYFPPDFRTGNQNILSDLTIPNEKFCTEQKLSGTGQHLILPWWYHFCARYYENREKIYESVGLSVPYYRGVLDAVRAYKKKMKDIKNIWRH